MDAVEIPQRLSVTQLASRANTKRGELRRHRWCVLAAFGGRNKPDENFEFVGHTFDELLGFVVAPSLAFPSTELRGSEVCRSVWVVSGGGGGVAGWGWP